MFNSELRELRVLINKNSLEVFKREARAKDEKLSIYLTELIDSLAVKIEMENKDES